MNDIMLKVEKDGNWLYLSTYDRKHGKSVRFLSRTEQVMDELKKNDYVSFVDADCGNFLHFRRNKDRVLLDFVWIRGGDNLQVIANTQKFPMMRCVRCATQKIPRRNFCAMQKILFQQRLTRRMHAEISAVLLRKNIAVAHSFALCGILSAGKTSA